MDTRIEDDDLTPDERTFIESQQTAASKDEAESAHQHRAQPVEEAQPVEKEEGDRPSGGATDADKAKQAADEAQAKDDAKASDAEALDPQALAAVAEPQEQQPFVPKLTAPPVDDIRTKLGEQRKAFLEQRKAFSEGKLTDEEFERAEAAYESERERLLIDLAAAEALKRSAEQIERQLASERKESQNAVLKVIAAQAKQAGVDYSDGALATQFDRALDFVAADPAWADRSFGDIAAEANRLVFQRLGKETASQSKPKPAAQEPPQQKQPRQVPPTIGGLPTAGATPVQNDLMTRITTTTDPDEVEAMLERLPAGQREALMRSTVQVR